MPVDITANFIRIRVASPKSFIRFRVKTLGAGIKAVIGFKKGGGSQIQSVLFPKSKYNLSQARAWIKKHGYAVHETQAFAVIDINPLKEGEAMFIEYPITIEETEKDEPVKKDKDYYFNLAMKSLELE